MPILKIVAPGEPARSVRLTKRVTSLGAASDNDVVLPSSALPATCAHVVTDGEAFEISAIDRVDLIVRGKKRRKHRLAHGDELQIGDVALAFHLLDDLPVPSGDTGPLAKAGATAKRPVIDAYRQLHDFSARLLENYRLDPLLDALMDAVIDVTHADKGFLVLLESGEPTIKVARNVRRENIAPAITQLSDSILARVVRDRAPLIISDALRDEEFKTSLSVVNLKLCSVMCVPLLERGNLLGVIYVGNDRVASLFDQTALDVLMVFAAQASLLIRNALLVQELTIDKGRLEERLEAMRFGQILGACAAMQEVFRKVDKIAVTDISVLITGETGTGKELIAREIHNRSPRRKGPFVSINCGAIPEMLLESELFGHVRGAFTGAIGNKPGRFHAASGGTLFLDEIGDMPISLQVKILRALEEKAVMRVGDTRADPVDIRVVAATNRELDVEIKAGRFREDLFYRLNVVALHLPPLRERGDDIVLLARYLLAKFCEEYASRARGFAPSTIVALRRFGWPGNIRQLENHLKKAVVLSDRALLSPADLGISEEALPPILPLTQAREEWQRRYINEVLARNGGNRTKTARDLGVDPRTIFRHLERENGEPEPGGEV
ncbi:MAG: sigma 54-interacting transcriptional regulator [Myxococcota bacterium]